VDQQNWAAKLLWYKPGRENRGADTLSHIYEDSEHSTMTNYPHWLDGKEVVEEVYMDKVLHEIIDDF
jgi:hypothetical protein